MIQVEKHIINHNASAREAFRQINEVSLIPILFVVDDQQQCIGSLTDGDLRRFILKDGNLETNVKALSNPNFHYLTAENNTIPYLKTVKERRYVPLLDANGRIVKIFDFNLGESYIPCSALIMAGGKGTRLMPLTADTPKPLLKVGERTILDITISRLVKMGIQHIYISVHHLKEQIIAFVEGQNYDAQMHFVEELEPSGTLGAIKYMGDWKYDHLLVMNSDLLTNINFESFLEDTIAQDAWMSVVSIPYKVAVPYAVMDTDKGFVKGLREKPTLTFQTNAGIYMINKRSLQFYGGQIPFNAPDLMEILMENEKAVRSYSFNDYWLDIGKHADFDKAQEDVKNLSL